MLAGVHEIGQLGPARAQLFGNLAPGFARMGAVGLVESLADRGGDNGVLAARDVGESIPDPVNAASLPGRFEHPGNGCLEAGVGIADHQLDPTQPPGAEGTQKLGPEGLGL